MTRKDKLFAQNWVEQYRRNLTEQLGHSVEDALRTSLSWYGAICSIAWYLSAEENLFGSGRTWSRRADYPANTPFTR